MKNLLHIKFYLLGVLAIVLSSCEVIGDIFKAGLWVGVIGVFLVVALVLWIMRKIRR
ncbi:MAG TPA: hypothetical protein VF691_19245 [Cytophagaceae bacterium]|jgi:hypothetical protein